MIDLCSDKSTCCGCGACIAICPESAISMVEDEYGFLYPHIDSKLCIECHLCERVCAFKNVEISKKKPLQSYIGINKNPEDLYRSASGGAFSAIAKFILDGNGVVIGCSWNENFEAEHIIVDDYKSLYKLQGSKYVQSDTDEIFEATKRLLRSKKRVFFSGTPCQVAGLKNYLDENYDGLLTADLICHGTPSMQFFNSYIKWYEKKNNCQVVDVNFRDKNFGWNEIGSISFKKKGRVKNRILTYNEDPYFYMFMYGYFLRESCYKCKYAGAEREGDLTLGDFWGIQKFYPEFNCFNGVSAILVNTSKGEKIIKQIKDYINIIPTKYEYIEANNEKLRCPTNQPKDRYKWLQYWQTGGFDLVVREFYQQKWKTVLISKMKRRVPRKVKNLIKQVRDIIYLKRAY